ncbi:hypothetical protein GIS00_11920 [Nakamurella sp. YIM 132087]|uniref:Uncharacterized protein n=1 Tax=Nakamurella alba TaxID=2665158 RepID=A0A7K1FKR9_9ACTN|nr:hypothetical protein [Nakamurella alba]MTD14650.1 hypothetical protein [Nakamurella alba]
MTEDEISSRKAAAAADAGSNHGVGVNADEPSAADRRDDQAPDPVTGDTEHHAAEADAASNEATELPG